MNVRTGLAALLSGLLTVASGVVAQPFPAGASADEFERMLQERVVTIKVTAKRNADQVPDIAYGNGTIVSPAGMIVTAKHVINAFEDGEHQAPTYEVIRRTRDGSFSYDLRLAALHDSEYDAVAVPIENAGNLSLPYVCLQPDHMKMRIGSGLAMYSYAYWDISENGQPANVWRRVPHAESITLNAKEGFGDSSNYWAASAEFAPSESGAGILFDERLIGIVANSLVHRQGNVAVPVRGHNYFVPLGLVFQDLRLYFLDSDCGEDPQVAMAVGAVQRDVVPIEGPLAEGEEQVAIIHRENAIVVDDPEDDPNANSFAWTPGGSLRVCFFDGEPLARIIFAEAAADWTRGVNISFDFGQSPLTADCGPGPGDGDVKVAFEPDGGNHAYVGRTAEISIGERATVNLAALSKEKIDALAGDRMGEGYARARASALHEIGHVLGLLHTQLAAGGPCVRNFDMERMFEDGAKLGFDKESIQQQTQIPNWFGWPVYQHFDSGSVMMFQFPEEWFFESVRDSCVGNNLMLSADDRSAMLAAYGPAAGQP